MKRFKFFFFIPVSFLLLGAFLPLWGMLTEKQVVVSGLSGVATVDRLRLREAPSLSQAIIGRLSLGESFQWLGQYSVIKTQDGTESSGGESDIWLKVMLETSGQIGWLFSGGTSLAHHLNTNFYHGALPMYEARFENKRISEISDDFQHYFYQKGLSSVQGYYSGSYFYYRRDDLMRYLPAIEKIDSTWQDFDFHEFQGEKLLQGPVRLVVLPDQFSASMAVLYTLPFENGVLKGHAHEYIYEQWQYNHFLDMLKKHSLGEINYQDYRISLPDSEKKYYPEASWHLKLLNVDQFPGCQFELNILSPNWTPIIAKCHDNPSYHKYHQSLLALRAWEGKFQAVKLELSDKREHFKQLLHDIKQQYQNKNKGRYRMPYLKKGQLLEQTHFSDLITSNSKVEYEAFYRLIDQSESEVSRFYIMRSHRGNNRYYWEFWRFDIKRASLKKVVEIPA